MSNHDGSNLVADILSVMDINEYNIFKEFTDPAMLKFLKIINHIAVCEYDGNYGEIMQDLSKKYFICYVCFNIENNPDINFQGICKKCQ